MGFDFPFVVVAAVEDIEVAMRKTNKMIGWRTRGKYRKLSSKLLAVTTTNTLWLPLLPGRGSWLL
jgi:hypothetical protein